MSCLGAVRSFYQKEGFRLVEVVVSGLDKPLGRHGTKYIVIAPVPGEEH